MHEPKPIRGSQQTGLFQASSDVDSNRWWHLPKTKIGCFRMVKKFLSKQNATGYIRDKSRHHQVDGTPLDKKTPLGSEFAQDQTRNDAVGFLPGHASLAYFFFRGSSGSSNWASRLWGLVMTTAGGAMSTSGAGFGSIFDDSDEENRPAKDEW